LQQIDQELRRSDEQAALASYGRTQQRAFGMLTSTQLRRAFDLDSEPARLRDRYGRTLFGSSVLVGRKLVEAGVQFVNIFWDNYAPRLNVLDYGWDTHEVNFLTLRDAYLPRLDLTYSALLEDLDGRGMLDETLVVILSDFGRTPRVNNTAGPTVTPSSSPGPASAAARSTAPPTPMPPSSATIPSAPPTSAPRSMNAWASTRKCRSTTAPAGQFPWPTAEGRSATSWPSRYFFCPFSIFAQVSANVTARLKTIRSSVESTVSTLK
jgi:hypothetical protein